MESKSLRAMDYELRKVSAETPAIISDLYLMKTLG